MKLEVPVPEGWSSRTIDAGLLLEPTKGVELVVLSMGPADPDPEHWLERMLVIDEPTRIPDNLTLGRFRTDDGWEGIYASGSLGARERFAIYFAFLDYAAGVVATCADGAANPTWREPLLAALQRARPDFSDDAIHGVQHLLGQPPPNSEFEVRPHTAIEGWQRTFVGGAIVLSRVDHPTAGRIHILPQQPLRSASALFGDHPRSAIVTDEGELGLIGTSSSDRGEITLAAVFGDSSYQRIEAIATEPSLFALFRATARELAYRTTLGLGERRWRPYYFEPPPGWIGIARSNHTLWISTAMPMRSQVLRVFHARPPDDHERSNGARMFETLPAEFLVEQPRGPATFHTADDHECEVYVYRANLSGKEIRVFDGHIITPMYLYPLRLVFEPSLDVESAAIFEDVVRSIRLLPERRAMNESKEAVEHWTD